MYPKVTWVVIVLSGCSEPQCIHGLLYSLAFCSINNLWAATTMSFTVCCSLCITCWVSALLENPLEQYYECRVVCGMRDLSDRYCGHYWSMCTATDIAVPLAFDLDLNAHIYPNIYSIFLILEIFFCHFALELDSAPMYKANLLVGNI